MKWIIKIRCFRFCGYEIQWFRLVEAGRMGTDIANKWRYGVDTREFIFYWGIIDILYLVRLFLVDWEIGTNYTFLSFCTSQHWMEKVWPNYHITCLVVLGVYNMLDDVIILFLFLILLFLFISVSSYWYFCWFCSSYSIHSWSK